MVNDDAIDYCATLARTVAGRLETDRPGTAVEVEAELHQPGRRPAQYLEPISLGALIVSVASLAWTVYTDLKTKTANPAPEVIARTIRVRGPDAGAHWNADQRAQVIDITVEELTRNFDAPELDAGTGSSPR